MMSLSLSWTYKRDIVSLLIKFELNKIILLNKIIILYKYYADVKNCESFKKMIMMSLSLSWTY